MRTSKYYLQQHKKATTKFTKMVDTLKEMNDRLNCIENSLLSIQPEFINSGYQKSLECKYSSLYNKVQKYLQKCDEQNDLCLKLSLQAKNCLQNESDKNKITSKVSIEDIKRLQNELNDDDVPTVSYKNDDETVTVTFRKGKSIEECNEDLHATYNSWYEFRDAELESWND